jgi:hypothetical protein
LPLIGATGINSSTRSEPIVSGRLGPRTLVTNVFTSRWCSMNGPKAPTAASSRTNGLHSTVEAPGIAVLRARVTATTTGSRSPGAPASGTLTGSTPTRLPSSPVPARTRAEIGTETTSRSSTSPRSASAAPSAPVTAVSTTSLTVPPAARAAVTTAARSAWATASVRCGPPTSTGPALMLHRGAVCRPLPSSSAAAARIRLSPGGPRRAGSGADGAGAGPSTSAASTANPARPSAST